MHFEEALLRAILSLRICKMHHCQSDEIRRKHAKESMDAALKQHLVIYSLLKYNNNPHKGFPVSGRSLPSPMTQQRYWTDIWSCLMSGQFRGQSVADWNMNASILHPLNLFGSSICKYVSFEWWCASSEHMVQNWGVILLTRGSSFQFLLTRRCYIWSEEETRRHVTNVRLLF